MAILRSFFKEVSILENNLVQTIASVGEGLAGGVIFTVPALFILGERISSFHIFLLSTLGGILGILFMIPMRRFLIVKEHGILPFPEGTACAHILKSAASAGTSAKAALIGLLAGAFHKICSSALYVFREAPSWTLTFFQKSEFSIDCTPSLLGVGFIVGPRISAVLLAGGAIGWWVLIPLIHFFGSSTSLVIFPSNTPLSAMTTEQIWSNYIRYIGAGTVAVGGLLSLVKIAPVIGRTVHLSLYELFQGVQAHVKRTDKDISLRYLVIGSLAAIVILSLFPGLSMNVVSISLLIILGFFFVAVTSLTVGLVGSTSNPISGMTIMVLLITSLIFVMLGWTERIYLISALTMSIVVNVAIALAGTTSQDLKTGFLVGATPRTQQLGEILGILLPAAAIGSTVYLLDATYGFGSKEMPAPQGTMMALIAQGVMQGDIPWTLVMIGVILGLVVEMLKLPVLPFALGLYLPLSLSTAMMCGGIVSLLVKKKDKTEKASQVGILAASGLVAGDACMGVVVALLALFKFIPTDKDPFLPDSASLLVYVLLALFLGWISLKKKPS